MISPRRRFVRASRGAAPSTASDARRRGPGTLALSRRAAGTSGSLESTGRGARGSSPAKRPPRRIDFLKQLHFADAIQMNRDRSGAVARTITGSSFSVAYGRTEASRLPAAIGTEPSSERSEAVFPGDAAASLQIRPARMLMVSATITTLKKKARMPCASAMRRRRWDSICTSDTWNVMPMTNEK
jgi:hypothetical protein